MPAQAQTTPNPLEARVADRLTQVNRMLAAASRTDANGLMDAKTEIEEMPYPTRGDRRQARKLNATALEKFKAEQMAAALTDFEKAWQADPSDQEVTNNYGYVLYRSNRLAEAEGKLRYTLALAPARAAAWANLAEVFGAQGQAKRAAEAFTVSHRFSRNPDVTRQYIEKFAATAEVPALKEGAALALQKLFPSQNAQAGTAATTQTLVVTDSERKSVDAGVLQAAPSTPPPVAAAKRPEEAEIVVPVALRNPMQRLLEGLPPSDVPRLMQRSASGSSRDREELLQLANKGDARAQHAVGYMYHYGRGVESDIGLANGWYRKSAANGFVLAQFALAYNQHAGIGTLVDNEQAAVNYRLAAEQGHPYAMNNLAILIEREHGVAIGNQTAFAWYQRAAEAGLARGAYNVGQYLELKRTSLDRKRAFAYYRSAANVGFSHAELRVAQMYEFGLEGTKDKEQAIIWYKRAALQGLETAQNALRQMGITEY